AMWFHRPFRADEWLLYDQESQERLGPAGAAYGHRFALVPVSMPRGRGTRQVRRRRSHQAQNPASRPARARKRPVSIHWKAQ
ncbi:hypothetical protein ACWEQJ_36385, partial [Streptomyces cyaneofuscatus]